MTNSSSTPQPSQQPPCPIELPSPPSPRLAFRVGVVGHRPKRLSEAGAERSGIEKSMVEILRTVQEEVGIFGADNANLFAEGNPVLRAVSPLAEGSDRVFAHVALDLGYELCVPMPFPQAEFEEDFAPGKSEEDPQAGSVDAFRSLLERAKEETGNLTTFEMDGDRARRSEAYGACGRVVLNQSDLLVVVWDGNWKEKNGGTDETLLEARRTHVPVVWIDARTPHRWQMLSPEVDLPKGGLPSPADTSGNLEALRQSVEGLLRLPQVESPSATPHEKRTQPTTPRKGITDFLKERKPPRKPAWAVIWKGFRDIFGDGKIPDVSQEVEPFEKSVIAEWLCKESTPIERIVNTLRKFYAWPDKLGVYYSDCHRSMYILCYFLAAVAVAAALVPVLMGWLGGHSADHPPDRLHVGESIFIIGELIAICVIILLVWYNRHARWHERWMDYRLTAELVRHLRLHSPLGGGRILPGLPAHLTGYGHPANTWMAWYVRAVERDIGLFSSAVLHRAHLQESLDHLLVLLSETEPGQVKYHEGIQQRYMAIDHRLHLLGLCCLWLTLGCCLAHLFLPIAGIFHLGGILTFVCGTLPALGAATAGINNQGEFARIARRSKAMVEHLDRLRRDAAALREVLGSREEGARHDIVPGQVSSRLASLSEQTVRLMVDEALDWRVVFLDRPPVEPA